MEENHFAMPSPDLSGVANAPNLWLYSALQRQGHQDEKKLVSEYRPLVRDFYVFSASSRRTRDSVALHSVHVTNGRASEPFARSSANRHPPHTWFWSRRSESGVSIVACFELVPEAWAELLAEMRRDGGDDGGDDDDTVAKVLARVFYERQQWELVLFERLCVGCSSVSGALRVLTPLLGGGSNAAERAAASELSGLAARYRGGFVLADGSGALASVTSTNAASAPRASGSGSDSTSAGMTVEWFGRLSSCSASVTPLLGGRFEQRVLEHHHHQQHFEHAQPAYVVVGSPVFWHFAAQSEAGVSHLGLLQSIIHTRCAKVAHGGHLVAECTAGPMSLEQLQAEIAADLAQQEPFDTLISGAEQWLHERKLLPAFLAQQPERDLAFAIVYLVPRDRPAAKEHERNRMNDLCSIMDQSHMMRDE